MRVTIIALSSVAMLGAAGGIWVTAPKTVPPQDLAGITPDLERGAFVYTAAGCASCHLGDEAGADELGGGMAFPTGFGTFYAPNISSDPEHGIGGWSALDFVNAVHAGVSPTGAHYYPALPYGSYTRARPEDFVHLHAYMATLPAVDTPSRAHEVSFPYNIRRSLGGWKALFVSDDWVIDPATLNEQEREGQYLVEALGHCGECHTPRNALGGPDLSRWLAGVPDPSGRGNVPNITPAALDWSTADIAYYLETGFTPDFDTAGGHMAAVLDKFAQLGAADREAVAAYLKRVPPVE